MTILLLAGTLEARKLAELAHQKGLPVIASLAGETRFPANLGVQTRRRGYGGADGFAQYLKANNVSQVIDATHPFAIDMTRRSAHICAKNGVPYRYLARPPWEASSSDNWISCDDIAKVKDHLPLGISVFLATGRKSLDNMGDLSGRKTYLRVVDPPEAPFPYEGGEFIVARPPYTFEKDLELFQMLKIDVLVCKNAGGASGLGKLRAAAKLKLPVVMVEQPKLPQDIPTVHSVSEALAWLKTP